jgi:Lanthionine synthetase C-like protein/HopA1 effector protein family
MTSCREQIEGAIQATVFLSPSKYSWFGKPSPRLTAHFERALSQKAIQSWLLLTLQGQLYSDFYCQGTATPSVKEANAFTHQNVGEFIDELSGSNCGAGYLAEGWQVTSLPNNELIARRNGRGFRVQKTDCHTVNGELLDPAARVSLRFPKELLGISPGFYMAVSDVEMPDFHGPDVVDVVRFYWNLRAEGAVPLMQELTRELNCARLPFRFKVVNDRGAFSRCDAAVLYVPKSDYAPVAQIVERIYPKISERLNERAPAFTKRLAPGLGFAEDPGTKHDSFGTHRCRLLAEGMFRAWQQGRESLPDRLRIVEAHFAKNAISLETPFLNPGSADIYELGVNSMPVRRDSGEMRPASYSTKDYLGVAARIASRLIRQAIWHRNQCNWVGFQPLERSLTPQGNATLSALGPELYSGTSGVALFLGELYAATGDADVRRTALGAIAQALSHLDVLPAPARPGLFSGSIGIALVAARLGRILQEEKLLRAARRVVQRCQREKLENWEFDFIFGKAGTIVGLLTLREMLGAPALLDLCIPLARKLLNKVDKSKTGYSWPSAALHSSRNLTGFAHGAAGIGYALLELFLATGDSKYRTAAESAFAYERHWYDPSQQNWPDLREWPGQPRPSRKALPFATAWCHGAPGIALSRLRAYEILKDDSYEAEASVALETARRAVESWLHSSNANYSLCHGLAGNAEVLRYGSEVLGPPAPEAAKVALQGSRVCLLKPSHKDVAAKGIESFGRADLPWPCGTPGGENPSLMLGLAGIGHFYLRLAAPSVPGILILRREDFSQPTGGTASGT